MAKIVRITGTGEAKVVEKNLTAEGARRLADQMRRGHAAGSSTQYRVVSDETQLRDVR